MVSSRIHSPFDGLWVNVTKIRIPSQFLPTQLLLLPIVSGNDQKVSDITIDSNFASRCMLCRLEYEYLELTKAATVVRGTPSAFPQAPF